MLEIGLTGGIASGKSTVGDLFANHGITVIDADAVAREVVEPGSPALAEIAAEFGGDVLSADGELDRRRLRELVFADEARRKRLEGILHPAIRQRMRATVEACRARQAPYCISMIPLLLETGQHRQMDRVLVVDVDEETQIRRVMARDDCDREHAAAILATQASRAARLGIADDVIENNGTSAALADQVDRLHDLYLQMAADGRGKA